MQYVVLYNLPSTERTQNREKMTKVKDGNSEERHISLCKWQSNVEYCTTHTRIVRINGLHRNTGATNEHAVAVNFLLSTVVPVVAANIMKIIMWSNAIEVVRIVSIREAIASRRA